MSLTALKTPVYNFLFFDILLLLAAVSVNLSHAVQFITGLHLMLNNKKMKYRQTATALKTSALNVCFKL